VTAGLVGKAVDNEAVIGVTEAAWKLLVNFPGVETSVADEKEAGVHVGGILNGVTVGICKVGPRGLSQAPAYSQKTKPKTVIAITARKARMIFWREVITFLGPENHWRS
jgi:hypothetical protein